MDASQALGTAFLESALFQFRFLKSLGDGTLAQLSEGDVAWSPDPETNSIGIIVKHLHGNMLSRWTDFLTTDGEKEWRTRDAEFEGLLGRAEATRLWEEGWSVVFAALEPLTPVQLLQIVTIRGKEHTVLDAIHRQIQHYGYHVGQIVQLGKMRRGAQWRTLSIARGRSLDYRPEGRQ